jgi:hypothetical protein
VCIKGKEGDVPQQNLHFGNVVKFICFGPLSLCNHVLFRLYYIFHWQTFSWRPSGIVALFYGQVSTQFPLPLIRHGIHVPSLTSTSSFPSLMEVLRHIYQSHS